MSFSPWFARGGVVSDAIRAVKSRFAQGVFCWRNSCLISPNEFKPRIGALFALILCGLILIFEWPLRTRVGTVHPMALIIFSAGVTLSFTDLIAPEITRPTAEGKLSPLAHPSAWPAPPLAAR